MSAASLKVKVFLCGEGRNELGSRCGHPAYQTDAEPGVLHALLRREERGVASKDGRTMVLVVENADLDKLARDAASLAAWLARARAVLPPMVAKRAPDPR